LIIKHKGYKKVVLKNFGTKDVTGSSGSVKLYLGNQFVEDLRKGSYLPKYTSFSSKKLSYNGNWHAEVIDASKLSKSGSDGVNIKGNGGNDVITGSKYNDTISGGGGNDKITGGSGKNTLDGNNGSDTYYLFKNIKNENSTIKDTGSSGTDTAILNTALNKLKVWFNIDNKGKTSGAINVRTKDGSSNKATLSGIETIKSVSDDGTYKFNNKSSELRQEVAAWLNTSGHKYSDVNAALEKATVNQQNELIAIFTKDEYWTPSS
jgi:Ca2+-binding RTX toxin-like protein